MLSAAYEQPIEFPDCKRQEVRTNMFVMANLSFGGRSSPVKIRNMSPGGALIDGPVLPTVGTPCRLFRGDISIEAEVMWANSARIGVKFRNIANIDAWLPSGRRTQNEVDQAVAAAKAERTTAPPFIPNRSLESALLANVDINATADALAVLADELADEPAVVARFMTKLQTLDVSVQMLRNLAELLQSNARA